MLETSRCILDKLKQEDYEEVKKLYRSEEVRRFLGGRVEESEYDQGFSSIIITNTQEYYWTVRRRNTKDFVGLVSLDKHHDGISIELSYQILPEFWGQGYGTEIIERIMEFAFEELKLKKLVAETQVKNKASCRLLEKVGFRIEQKVMRFGEEQYIFSCLFGGDRLGEV